MLYVAVSTTVGIRPWSSIIECLRLHSSCAFSLYDGNIASATCLPTPSLVTS